MEVNVNGGLRNSMTYTGQSMITNGNKIRHGDGVLTKPIPSENINVSYNGNWKDNKFLTGNISISGTNKNFEIKVNDCKKQLRSQNEYNVSIKLQDNVCFSGKMKTGPEGVIDSNFCLDGFLSSKHVQPTFVKIKQFPFWTTNHEIDMEKVDKIKHWQNWIRYTDHILRFMNRIEKKDFENSLKILVTEFKTSPDDR